MLLTRDATEAEDLVQETYLCAIPRVASLRVGSNLKSWLFAILRNIWLKQLRCGGVAPKIVAFEMYETIADTIIETSEYLHASDVSQLEHDRMQGCDSTASCGVSRDHPVARARRAVLSGNLRDPELPARNSDVLPGESTHQTTGLAFKRGRSILNGRATKIERRLPGRTSWFTVLLRMN